MKFIWESFLHITHSVAADFIPASIREAWSQKMAKHVKVINEQFLFLKLVLAEMSQQVQQESRRRINWSLLGLLGVFVAGTAVILALFSSSATAEYELPPRGTPSTEVSTNSSFGVPVGVRIHLQGEFVESWPWDSLHWQQDLWHEIEWLDEDNNWVEVNGWRGNFDTIFPEETRMVAQRELWATDTYLGSGPFRWKVFYGENGRLLQTSDPFYLPAKSGEVVTVRQELWPR